jgi:hypothetical protein
LSRSLSRRPRDEETFEMGSNEFNLFRGQDRPLWSRLPHVASDYLS